MDDKYYYKIRSAAMELDYLAREVHDAPNGLASLVESEAKRAEIRTFLAKARASIELVQNKMGTTFTSEFRNE